MDEEMRLRAIIDNPRSDSDAQPARSNTLAAPKPSKAVLKKPLPKPKGRR